MTQQFELTQWSTAKSLLVWFPGIPVVMVVALVGNEWLLPTGASTNVHLAWGLLVLLGGLYLLSRIVKVVSAIPTRITVAPDQLTIYTPKNGEEVQVPYAHITAYRASSVNGAEALRLTLQDNSKLHLRFNSRFFGDQDFDAMVAAFETAMGNCQPAADPIAKVRRERTFFEKPISTHLLVVLTAGLAWLGWFIVTHSLPLKASIFMVASSYLTYVAAWYAARARRTQTEETA